MATPHGDPQASAGAAIPMRRTTINASAARLRMSVSLLPELPHLSLQLPHPGIGLGGAAELLRREQGADVERRLRAVAQDLFAELTDVLQLRLHVGQVHVAWREQLARQVVLGLSELFISDRATARRAATSSFTFAS